MRRSRRLFVSTRWTRKKKYIGNKFGPRDGPYRLLSHMFYTSDVTLPYTLGAIHFLLVGCTLPFPSPCRKKYQVSYKKMLEPMITVSWAQVSDDSPTWILAWKENESCVGTGLMIWAAGHTGTSPRATKIHDGERSSPVYMAYNHKRCTCGLSVEAIKPGVPALSCFLTPDIYLFVLIRGFFEPGLF